MNWLNNTDTGKMVQSWVKVFVSTILAMVLADFTTGNDVFSATSLWTYASAGVVAVLPLVINYLNPEYSRYGVGSDSDATPTEVEFFDEEYQGE